MTQSMALLTLALDDKTIDLLAETILKKMVAGLSPEALEKLHKQYPPEVTRPSGLDEFKPPTTSNSEVPEDGDEEDPWLPASQPPAGGKTGNSQPAASSAEQESNPAGSSVETASGQSSGETNTFTNGKGWVYQFDPPGGPRCGCGNNAALVTFTSTKDGKLYKVYKCRMTAGREAGYDFKRACTFSQFINNRRSK